MLEELFGNEIPLYAVLYVKMRHALTRGETWQVKQQVDESIEYDGYTEAADIVKIDIESTATEEPPQMAQAMQLTEACLVYRHGLVLEFDAQVDWERVRLPKPLPADGFIVSANDKALSPVPRRHITLIGGKALRSHKALVDVDCYHSVTPPPIIVHRRFNGRSRAA